MMRVEWKQKGYDWLRAVLWAACGILPLPFGAFASGKPYIAAASILVFFILSFAVPLWLGYRRRKAGRYDDYASAGATFYGGAVALIVAVGLLNGLIGSSLWHSYWGMVFLFTLWMLLTIAAQYGAAKGVDFGMLGCGDTGIPSSLTPSYSACPFLVPSWGCSSFRPSAMSRPQ